MNTSPTCKKAPPTSTCCRRAAEEEQDDYHKDFYLFQCAGKVVQVEPLAMTSVLKFPVFQTDQSKAWNNNHRRPDYENYTQYCRQSSVSNTTTRSSPTFDLPEIRSAHENYCHNLLEACFTFSVCVDFKLHLSTWVSNKFRGRLSLPEKNKLRFGQITNYFLSLYLFLFSFL